MAHMFRQLTNWGFNLGLYLFGYIYGIWFVYRLTKRFVTNPFQPFWKVTDRPTPPDCMNDPALGNHAYIQLKDVKLHYVENGDKTKPLMLCLHGFPDFWYSWRHQLREFSSDYWVVAVDMRGYGDSDKPGCQKDYKLDILIEDIKHLITTLGREKCTLVAHDWGGIVAWYFVLLEPQFIDSYVIMSSVHPIAFYYVLYKSLDQFWRSWYILFFQLPFLPELVCRMDDLNFITQIFKTDKSPSPAIEEDIEAYKYTFAKPGAFTPPINYYRANFGLKGRYDLVKLGKVKTLPSGLILCGEKDKFLSGELQEQTVKLVVNTRLIIVKGANHFIHQDEHEFVNNEMRKFFNKVESQ